MKLFKEYVSLLKNFQSEEFVDVIFYRPIAFLLVIFVKYLPISPNQISFIAIIAGVIAAYFFSLGDDKNFVVGALFYALSNVVDCLDGMIARLKMNGTKIGKIVDGAADYIVSILVYIGFSIGLAKAVDVGSIALPFKPWILVAIAGANTIIHAAIFDYFKKLYESHVYGKMSSPQNEINEFSSELNRLNQLPGNFLDKFLIKVYIKYSKLQLGKNSKVFVKLDPELYSKHNKILVVLWSFIGPACHITMLVIAALLYKPMIFFYYAIVFANVWMVMLAMLQIKANSLLKSQINK